VAYILRTSLKCLHKTDEIFMTEVIVGVILNVKISQGSVAT